MTEKPPSRFSSFRYGIARSVVQWWFCHSGVRQLFSSSEGIVKIPFDVVWNALSVSKFFKEGANRRAMESLSDPATVIDSESVEFCEEESVEHQHHFELYEPIEGMVVVGLTNAEGETLLLHKDTSHAVLPYAQVESGEDWVAVARRELEELGVAVEIEGLERVRRKYFTAEEEENHETMGYDVVLRASPAVDGVDSSDISVPDKPDWDASWFADVPTDAAAGAVLDDIQLFFD